MRLTPAARRALPTGAATVAVLAAGIASAVVLHRLEPIARAQDVPVLTTGPVTAPKADRGRVATDVEQQTANAAQLMMQVFARSAPEATLRQVETGDQLARELSLVASGGSLVGQNREVAGGMDWVHLRHVAVHEDSARVRGTASLWVRDATSEPHNVYELDTTLVKVAGVWKVRSLGERFAPGGGP